ncbi:uncharacterized protein LOC109134680 [Beta vulgaris subsp. vulgaris]|uniref:uncharacterized protein LOC109134680 n=1 Tax=Beta vulgaris subsp. vulgaris TaxID=3555 RepID=UPI002036F082|nr:uncharacterized protein LOC109134680 [Beta vulgaris subsp. vulgaris]
MRGNLTIPAVTGGKKPFRFFKMWQTHPQYMDIITQAWQQTQSGTKMFLLVKKLKAVKGELKKLNRERFGDIAAQDAKAYLAFQVLQDALHADPSNEDIANREREAQTEYLSAHKTYMQFLAQKAKSEWLKEGDENTSFFHQAIKQRHIQNSIFHKRHAWKLTRIKLKQSVVDNGPLLDDVMKGQLNATYTKEEIKAAMWAIDGGKAPGPNGFGSSFFKGAWEIVGDEVYNAVLDFLNTGKLLKEINATGITLIPKGKCAESVKDFRPISCCNAIYKCISKSVMCQT